MPADITASSFPLLGLSAMVLSSDARTLYVVSMLDDALVVFNVAVAGGITQRQVIVDGTKLNGRDVDGLGGAAGLTLTSDSVYVTGWGDKAVSVFTMDAETGDVATFVDRIKGGERLFDTFPQHDIANDEVITDGNVTANYTLYDVSLCVCEREYVCVRVCVCGIKDGNVTANHTLYYVSLCV